MKKLLQAIYAKCASGTTLHTDIGGRFYFQKAPQGTTGKYVIFYILTDTPEYDFGSKYEETDVQFSIFADSKTSANDVLTTMDNVKALFDDCALTLTNYTHFKMQREFETVEQNPDDETFYGVIQYQVQWNG
jgi:hypothetical protein